MQQPQYPLHGLRHAENQDTSVEEVAERPGSSAKATLGIGSLCLGTLVEIRGNHCDLPIDPRKSLNDGAM